MAPALTGICLRLLHRTSELVAKPTAAISFLLTGALICLTAYGGGSMQSATPLTTRQPFTSDGAGDTVLPGSGPETGPAAKIVPIAGTAGAVVALFPVGRAYYSPDGFHLDGTGSTTPAY